MDDRDEDDPPSVTYTSSLDALVLSTLTAYGDLWQHLHDTSEASSTSHHQAMLTGLADDVAIAFAQLAMRGAPAKAIQELAGHADLTTTMRYMHLSPAARDGAIALLDQVHAEARPAPATVQPPPAATASAVPPAAGSEALH